MPLTEINVTNPPPVYANYWREREAARAAAPPPPPWPAIDPGLLEEGRPGLPAFPLKVFPHQWREWVSDAAHWAGSSEDYVAQALLASVAGLCGQGVSARITEAWSEPVILWQALVGGPSSGKTPALEWLRRPLGTVERVLAREGGGPVVVSDAALPALQKAVARRPQGVLLWRDEPTAWLAGLGRKSRRDESRRGPFLDTWGAIGFPWGRDKTAVSTAVSIVGSLDPERLDAALEGTGDGLAARFLYVWPGPAPYRSLRTVKPVREDEMVSALQRIARAVGTPEKPLVLAFEDQAVTIFDGCLERLHGETLQAEGLLAGWLGKGRGTVARLAAVLALLDWTANRPANAPPPAIITAQHLHAAWELWERYYRPHAQRGVRPRRAVGSRPQGAAGDRLDPRARSDGNLARGCAARRAAAKGERRRCGRGDPGTRGGGRPARGRRRGGLSGPRPPGAALAGQSGAARRTRCGNCGKENLLRDSEALSAHAVGGEGGDPRLGGEGEVGRSLSTEVEWPK